MELASAGALRRDHPCYSTEGWDASRFGIQSWLERTAWRSLSDTTYGCSGDPMPHAVVFDDELINQIYKLDIATFLTAEQLSVEGISKLVSAAPDEASMAFLATQTLDEARHFEVFCRRLADVGVAPDERRALVERVQSREMRTFYDLIREQVDRRDYIAALVAHNIVLEGMAYPVYRYEIRYWSVLDPALSQIIQGAFADEVQHVTFGMAYLRDAMRGSTALRNRVTTLARDCNVLMTSVFESVIDRYIALYQEAANAHLDLMGDIEIFPGRRIAQTGEEEQVRLLLAEIQQEHRKRLGQIGIEP